jgi:hypothetical protein
MDRRCIGAPWGPGRAGRRQVAGSQHGGVGVDPAVRGQVQAQRPAMAAAPDRHDVSGDKHGAVAPVRGQDRHQPEFGQPSPAPSGFTATRTGPGVIRTSAPIILTGAAACLSVLAAQADQIGVRDPCMVCVAVTVSWHGVFRPAAQADKIPPGLGGAPAWPTAHVG